MPRPYKHITPVDRFWAKVAKSDGCWIWTGLTRRPSPKITILPYGVFKIGSRNVATHRFSYELHNGVIPHGFNVLHKCDNARCVNPDHLFIGTQQANVDDCIHKGRKADPRRLPQTKLSDSVVKEIRNTYIPYCRKFGGASLCRKFGISSGVMSGVVNKTRWKTIT